MKKTGKARPIPGKAMGVLPSFVETELGRGRWHFKVALEELGGILPLDSGPGGPIPAHF